jgi:superfamily II DNA/RNA helicase
VEAAPSGTVAVGIEEVVYSVKPEKKPDLLLHLLEQPDWDQVLVFTRTKAGADALESRLERHGIRTDAMHSDRRMKHRERALDRFAKGEVRVLVATDVAQRGLDVDGISHVVNYDIPLDPEDYVHRIGRTGRAGESGHAVSFACEDTAFSVPDIEAFIGNKIPTAPVRGELLAELQPPSKERLTGQTREAASRERDRRGGRGAKPDGGGGKQRRRRKSGQAVTGN